ncbi:MAG: DsbA family protein [Gemmatimonadota bacterium]|nr:DsbA family protein [Gemmatimonadota bacterium]
MGPSVYLYGDYACPFTYVMNARLDLLASEGIVTTVWRPLPTHGPDGAEDWRSLGETSSDLKASVEDVRRAAASLGLPFRLPERPPSTWRALLASEFARDCGQTDFLRFHRAVFRAVFSAVSDIGDADVLADIAEQAGIDLVGLEAALTDRRYESVLHEAESEAEEYGIEATPTVLIGRYKLVGAAPLEVIRNAVVRARQPEES